MLINVVQYDIELHNGDTYTVGIDMSGKKMDNKTLESINNQEENIKESVKKNKNCKTFTKVDDEENSEYICMMCKDGFKLNDDKICEFDEETVKKNTSLSENSNESDQETPEETKEETPEETQEEPQTENTETSEPETNVLEEDVKKNIPQPTEGGPKGFIEEDTLEKPEKLNSDNESTENATTVEPEVQQETEETQNTSDDTNQEEDVSKNVPQPTEGGEKGFIEEDNLVVKNQENTKENESEESLNNDKKARDSEEELENEVPENTSETEEKEEPEVEEEKEPESKESEESENPKDNFKEEEEKQSSDENESSEENKSSEVDNQQNSNTDTASKVIEDFDKETTQDIVDEQDKLDSIKNKLAFVKERQDKKNKKIETLKEQTEGLDDEISDLEKEQEEKESELEATKKAQLEKREELMQKVKEEELEKEENSKEEDEDNVESEKEKQAVDEAEKPEEDSDDQSTEEVAQETNKIQKSGSNRDHYRGCLALELDKNNHTDWNCIKCDDSLGYTLTTDGKCFKEEISHEGENVDDEQEPQENSSEDLDEKQKEQEEMNKKIELDIQKKEYPHCDEYEINESENKVEACTECDKDYKLVDNTCYPEDMPDKCIQFEKYLKDQKPENFKAKDDEEEENLCEDEDKDTNMCNTCKPGARLTVCGNCVSANIAGGRSCLYDFDLQENEPPLFYCQEGRLLKKPARIQAKKADSFSNSFLMMPPSFREIIKMLKRP